MLNEDDFAEEFKPVLLSNVSTGQLLHTLNFKTSLWFPFPGYSVASVAEEEPLTGFSIKAIQAELISRRVASKPEINFSQKLFMGVDRITIAAGKIVVEKEGNSKESTPYLGIFPATTAPAERIKVAAAVVIGAVLTSNSVGGKDNKKEFVVTDAKKEFYNNAGVFSAKSKMVEKLTQNVTFKETSSGVRDIILANLMTNGQKVTAVADYLAKLISPLPRDISAGEDGPTEQEKMVTIFTPLVPQEKDRYDEYQKTSLGRVLNGKFAVGPVPRVLVPPNSKTLIYNSWKLLTAHRLIRGEDNSFVSSLTNPYLLGEIGAEFERVIPQCMDFIRMLNNSGSKGFRMNTQKEFTRVWEVLSCNALIHSAVATPYPVISKKVKRSNPKAIETLPKTGIYNMSRCEDFKNSDYLYLGHAGVVDKPTFSKMGIIYKDRDVNCATDRILNALDEFHYITTYAYDELFDHPDLVILPSCHAHANTVWVRLATLEEKERPKVYDAVAHATRTDHANRWKTWFPFHRRLFSCNDTVKGMYPVIRIDRRNRGIMSAFTDDFTCELTPEREAEFDSMPLIDIVSFENKSVKDTGLEMPEIDLAQTLNLQYQRALEKQRLAEVAAAEKRKKEAASTDTDSEEEEEEPEVKKKAGSEVKIAPSAPADDFFPDLPPDDM